MNSSKRIFLDLSGRRSFCVNIALCATGLLAVVGAASILMGVIFDPVLPRLKISETWRTTKRAAEATPFGPTNALPLKLGRMKADFHSQPTVLRLAFLNPYDLGSFASLQRHAEDLDAIIADCLTLEKSVDKTRLGLNCENSPHFDWLAKSAPHVRIFPLLTSQVTATQVAETLSSAHSRAVLIARISEYLQQHEKSAGLVIDLTSTPISTHRNFVLFLTELRSVLGAYGKLLIVSLDATAPSTRAQQLANAADYALLKTYDMTWDGQSPGPLALQGWFETRLQEFASLIGREKLIVGIGSFGYEWVHGIKKVVPVQHAWQQLALEERQIRSEVGVSNPNYQFRDGTILHDIWFLDAVTAFNQIRAAFVVTPAGFALWRLGLEDPGVWSMLGRGRFPDDEAVRNLSDIEPGYGAFERISGPVLAIGPYQSGRRTTTYHQGSGLITNEIVNPAPRQAGLRPFPAVREKELALTFDDGPSERNTERILDVLQRKSVKATFYVVGKNALSFPGFLRRIYMDGHDIGNHSFSHPDLLLSSNTRIRAELNGTQRVLECYLGIQTILLRPPYINENYSLLETSRDLVRVAFELGYVFAGYDVDSKDYLAISPSDIVKHVVAKVEQGGKVILFHDTEDDSTSTTDALPSLIDELQSRGFRFVTTSGLVGLPRDALMPLVAPASVGPIEMNARRTSTGILLLVASALPAFAIATAILGITRIILIAIGALIHSWNDRSPRASPRFSGKVAVIVPAYNEEKVICATIEGLLSSTVRDSLEIIVVDDGSTDATSVVLKNCFGDTAQLIVYRKQNGGKASALNFGIQRTEADIIVAIDGDTILLPDAIERLAAHFVDPTVGAVAGTVSVGNVESLLTRFQALEYITSQNMDRRAFALLNAIGVVPGAIGAWRRQALNEVGGYSTVTLAEDADLTIEVERRGWRVVVEPRAVALTEAPEHLRAFLKQRFRWTFGTLQVAYKHASTFWRLPINVSLITIPNILVFQIAFSLLAPVFDTLLLYTSALLVIGVETGKTLHILVSYWLFFQIIDVTSAFIGVAISGDRSAWRLLPLVLLQRFSYRYLLCIVTVRAVLAAVKGRIVGWGKLIRTGAVTHSLARGLHS